ncbi:MAG TPA: ABC-F family ATP-binding cassette domain-containing protein [Caulobacteraceae bacterium]|jgi:ATP-binding cassette subfamily F protein uup|nr:ABC-F family ATP-binding cassette domain-containing protein [Caulobacteraceae bacterium]
MAAPLLALRDVRLADGPRWLFDGVDISLQPRDRACLVGRNGAGKSTLLRILAAELEPDDGERTVSAGLRIALVAQEAPIAAATLAEFASGGGAAEHEARAALEAFELDPDRSPAGLSGGEARKASLARAFAADPDVLLLDEPTNHLDIPSIERLEAMIARCRAAVLLVSHDRRFLERLARRCFWLDGARVRRLDFGFDRFEAWSEGVLAAEAETARRLDKALEREQHWMERGVTARRARNEGRRRRLLAMRAAKAESLRQARGELSLASAAAPVSGRLAIEAKRVCKAFGDRQILSGFSTRIMRGDRVAIVGPNGAGKTTLVRLLLGELAPDEGSLRLGANLEIVQVDQARRSLAPGETMRSLMAQGGGDQIMVQGRPRHIAAYAKDFLFREEQLRQPVETLSGGERNRLLLALALARPSNLLVLDEPTNDLDMETLDLLEEMLADFEGTLLLVSHDRDFIDRLATSTIALDGRGGHVETPGGWSDFISQNPGFLDPVSTPKPRAKPPAVRARTAAPARLSFREQHRLGVLEARLSALPREIAQFEATLADSRLYARDPAAFTRTSAALEAARAELVAAEEEWLALEEQREALEKGRGEQGRR